MPTTGPSQAPSVFECTTGSNNGIYGDISSEVDRTIEYGYEIEATVTNDDIEGTLVPLVEAAVTDSILAELFAECGTTARVRQLRRRLEITGVTLNPEDEVLENGTYSNVQ